MSDQVTLNDLFETEGLRVLGTYESPVFVAADVAAKIGDTHYGRWCAQAKPIHAFQYRLSNRNGVTTPTWLFTERGLYRYLFRRDCPFAESFQDWVSDRLIELRKYAVTRLERSINESALQLKMERDRANLLDELCKKYKAKTADQSARLAQLEFQCGSLREVNGYLSLGRDREYTRAADHDDHTYICDHYIEMWLYEYKYRFPSESSMTNHNTKRLPVNFTRDDIAEEEEEIKNSKEVETWFKNGNYGAIFDYIYAKLRPRLRCGGPHPPPHTSIDAP